MSSHARRPGLSCDGVRPGKTLADRLNQPPVPPRTLNSRISTELETIILKCLDKDLIGATNPPRNFSWICAAGAILLQVYAAATIPGLGRVAKLIGYGVAGCWSCRWLAATNVGGLRDRMLGYTRVPRIRSLAVLPFENLSGNPDQDYFAEGLTDA